MEGLALELRIGPPVCRDLRCDMNRVMTLIFAACSLGITTARAHADDVASGEIAYNNACRTCHVLRPGENRLGPNLAGIVGRKAGSEPGYSYSSAMANAGFTWTPEKLDAFIANPDQVVPGNGMKPFGAIADAAIRDQIVKFLASKASQPVDTGALEVR
jgi:cytochrome c